MRAISPRTARSIRAWAGLVVGLTACGDGATSTSPEALTAQLPGHVWSYELWAPFPGTELPSQESDALWFGADGTYERYMGFTVTQAGTWSVNAESAIVLAVEGSPTTLTLPVTKATATSVTLEVPVLVTEVGGAPTALRTFRASDRCPAYLSRLDGRYAVYGLGIHQPSTTYEGWQAVAFDSHGDLHVIAARFQASQQQGFYLTSVGARCGLATFEFAPETAAVMAIDADDRMHIAYTEGTTIHYATRPARADASVPFAITTVASNALSAPKLALAVAHDGSVAIAASDDAMGYVVYQSHDPQAATPDWREAALPLTRDSGILVFGVSLAYDPGSRLHVAATGGGTQITVFRDDDGAWTPFALPVLPVVGSFFEGPQAFQIDRHGIWHFAAGSIGQPDGSAGTGHPGALLYGTGDAGGVTWRTVGAGGIASLAIDQAGHAHLYSLDRIFGGQHTIVAGDTITRFRVTAREATLDRMALGLGDNGRVAFGVGDIVEVALPAAELPEIAIPVHVELTNAQGARVLFPELGESCADACTFDAVDGRWLQWTWEAPPGIAPKLTSSTVCRGRELTGTCWALVSHEACVGGECPPLVDVEFAKSDVVAFHDVVPTADVGFGWRAGGVGASSAGVAMTLTRSELPATSRLVTWSAALVPQGAVALDGWGGARGAVRLAGGDAVVFGDAPAGATIGSESDFNGERVAVGVSAAGSVRWVHRGGASQMPVGEPTAIADDVAFFEDGSVVRLGPDGTPRFSTPLATPSDWRAAVLIGDGARTHVVGPLREEAAQSFFWQSRWARLGSGGAVEDDRVIDGWVLGAARDASGDIVMAVVLRQGQVWDGAAVAADALALATYRADGGVVKLGAPDTRHFAAAGAFSGWAPLASGVVVRDGALLVAEEIQPRVVALSTFAADAVSYDTQIGAQGAFGGAARIFAPTGLASTGSHVVLGGQAQGDFDFGAVVGTFQAATPALLELP